jgi:hypothetical protein
MLTALQESRILAVASPLLPITIRQFYGLGGLLEVGIALGELGTLSRRDKLLILAWLVTIFASYPIWLHAVGFSAPCGCLGDAYAWLGIKRSIQSHIENLAFVFLALTGYVGLIYDVFRCRKK